MATLTLNELKIKIAEILDEAKKKSSKKSSMKRKGAAVEAYGLYDEALDFSTPLGAFNLYRQQGAANWGPYTSDGPHIDSSFANPQLGATHMRESEERALRMLVREVIQNGLVPPDSAWAPLVEGQREPSFGSAWEAAEPLFEAWYDKFKKSSKKGSAEADKPKKGKGIEKTKYGQVKKHGFEKKSGK